MTLIPAVEVAASPSHFVAALHADPLARLSARPSFESRKSSQPDIINLENLGVEEAPIPAQSEPQAVANAYRLNVRKLNIKFAVICLALFLEGWNLGATGPLIPAIQKFYDVGIPRLQKRISYDSGGTGGLHPRIHDVPGSMCCTPFFTRGII